MTDFPNQTSFQIAVCSRFVGIYEDLGTPAKGADAKIEARAGGAMGRP